MRPFCWLLVCLVVGRAACAQPAVPRPAYPGPDGPVTLLVAQADGGVLVGGSFTHFAGRPSPGGLARLLPSGRPDTAFALPAAWVAYDKLHPTALAPLPDGRVVGTFRFLALSCLDCPAETERDFLVRLLPDGHFDPAFTPAVLPLPAPKVPRPGTEIGLGFSALAVQADGRLVLAGVLSGADEEVPYRHVLRLLPNGCRDLTFDAGSYPPQQVDQLAVLPNGFIALTHCCANLIERLRPDGCPDPGFTLRDFQAGSVPRGLSVLDSLAELSRQWSLPRDWESGIPTVMLAGPDNTLLVGGSEDARRATDPAQSLVRLLPSGRRDTTFVPIRGPDEAGVAALARQADGRVLAAYFDYEGEEFVSEPLGYYLRRPGLGAAYLTERLGSTLHRWVMRARWQWVRRWLPTGQPDPAFRLAGLARPEGEVHALALLPDGRILVGGQFTHYNRRHTPYLVCLRPDGRPDPAFARHP